MGSLGRKDASEAMSGATSKRDKFTTVLSASSLLCFESRHYTPGQMQGLRFNESLIDGAEDVM